MKNVPNFSPDIPLQHIAYHAGRYGKIAIGFHREAVVNAGFNPVMYTLENTSLLNNIYKGIASIDEADPYSAIFELDSLADKIEEILSDNDISESLDVDSVTFELDAIESAKDQIEESYGEFLAFIKTFNKFEFDTIYCEREWRSISNFKFDIEDIALIIIPKEQEGRQLYKEFLDVCKLPRSVSIASWEDLIEH